MPHLTTLFPSGWMHFLVGGLLIGVAVAFLFATTGRVGGMSTVFSSSWSWLMRTPYFLQQRYTASRTWRLLYAAGLVMGAAVWWVMVDGGAPQSTHVPAWKLLVGGLLVGYGARLGNGCTSGHGICGLGSLQWPSLLAVLTFMASAFLCANLVTRWLP